MKLKKFKEKKTVKVGVIGLGCLCLIAVGYLLHRTFASFQTNDTFKVMEGTLDYFGGSDIYFAFYQNGVAVDTMPTKESGLSFKNAECTNGASVSWNNETWEPTIKNLTKTKTKCTLYFENMKELTQKLIELASTDPTSLAYDGTPDNNLRYIGANPNNYVNFNGETWRIIGAMNNIDDGTGTKESRIKLIRNESIENIAWDINNVNDWSTASLQINLNSGAWDVWNLTEESKKYVSNAIWHLGGINSTASEKLSSDFYEYERGTEVFEGHPVYWTGIVGLIYPSDYGFATGGSSKETCLMKNLDDWFNYKDCYTNNWLDKGKNNIQWTITPYAYITDRSTVYWIDSEIGFSIATRPCIARPAVYLKENVKIFDGDGSENNPFKLSI